jgi:membrane peptidoglycan carboxypeptidase
LFTSPWHAVILVLIWRKVVGLGLAGLLACFAPAMALAIADELQSSRWQATVMSVIARRLSFQVEPGPSSAVRFPIAGPYDERLGYDRVPDFVERLAPHGYAVTAQSRMSRWLLGLAEHGLFPPYREKSQAGLDLLDCRGGSLSAARFPQRAYAHFDAAPAVLVDAVQFIENQGLLDADRPKRNPAVEWDRFAGAVADQALHVLDASHPTPGASTLATQIEKYRHSPDGRTESAGEKLRQMASASLRAYLDGEDTRSRRRQIVIDYLNTIPLAAKPGFGEVNGLGDGLWAWYGRDFAEVNALLADARDESSQPRARMQAQAVAFKQALSLIIAARRPAYYLPGDSNLDDRTDSYVRRMADAGLIGPTLRDAALSVSLPARTGPAPWRAVSFVDRKASSAVRARLSTLLDVPRSYDLDRLDLEARTTLDAEAQRAATRFLRGLREPAAARAAGLYGLHLLERDDEPGSLMFSVTLFERGERANRLRVQADSVDQPFDINEGARLDLGSTAKLRTLVTYLELVAALHARWRTLSPRELAALPVDQRDPIARWARQYLSRSKDRSLARMLDAAMLRTYSASPHEAFFTGGGMHRFENFDPEHDTRLFTVRDGFRHSVNLVFIRLMRDVVNHLIATTPSAETWPLDRRAATSRHAHLSRFADREGRQYLARFHRAYQGLTAEQAEDRLLGRVHATPARLAAVYGALEPGATVDDLARFFQRRLGAKAPSAQALGALHDRRVARPVSTADRALAAGVHPLELWLVGFLRHQPESTLADAIAASGAQRQDAYGWLFTTRNRIAQDERIRNQLELEAFREIQRRWRRLGYPFESLTPSYATAIGSSGDRPAALAELMGIIGNRGMRLPVVRIESLAFARHTPYETWLDHEPPGAQRVLSAEVADTVRRSLRDVVEGGTAGRLRRALVRDDGSAVELGGKTGTGDHRFDVPGRDGKVVSSRVVSRSATFAFLIDDRYFGTVMVYAAGPLAAEYTFTSALPVQLLKSMLPVLLPRLERGPCEVTGAPE